MKQKKFIFLSIIFIWAIIQFLPSFAINTKGQITNSNFLTLSYAKNNSKNNADNNTLSYKFEYQNEKIDLKAVKNEKGQLLFPVEEIVTKLGYKFEECSRCGKDEIYFMGDENPDGKGHFFVNWYQALLSFSGNDDTIQLSAKNEKFDGKTYSPADLFTKMGIDFKVNEKKLNINASVNKMTLVYFFSATCESCEKLKKLMEDLKKKYTSLIIKEYDIYKVEYYDLLKQYGESYNIEKEKIGFTPSVFINDQVLIGAEIQGDLENKIKNYSKNPPTTVLPEPMPGQGQASLDNEPKEGSPFIRCLTSFGLGFVNGLSPCSLSFFLFFLSLLLVKADKMIRCGIGFLAGKFVMFFLLGTILYGIISNLEMTSISFFLDIIMILFAFVFAILNIGDFFLAKKENFGAMKVQLPKGLKHWNQELLRKSEKYFSAKLGGLIMFGIGMIVAMGEFLCTGQIYLSSVVVMIQKESADIIPRFQLFFYSLGFIVPLLIVMLVIYFGKKVFGVSEWILDKIPLIKLITAILFVGMAVYMIIF